MRVVPAGVHRARSLALIGHVVQLGDRQRIHVGAKHDALPRSLAAMQDADDAGLGDAGLHLIEVVRAQPLGDEAGSLLLPESELRVLVEIAPVGNDSRSDLLGALTQLHDTHHRVSPFRLTIKRVATTSRYGRWRRP